MGKKSQNKKIRTHQKGVEQTRPSLQDDKTGSHFKTNSLSFTINDKTAILVTLAIALISYVFSYFYTSFYQGEEGAQYMNALGFWKYPNSILGNWPKTGWKIIYAPIILFGKQGALIANCLFSAFSGYFAYKTYAKLTGQKTILPFILLATQTLWFLLSFKFFSEIPTAFILILAIYLFYSKKYIGFAFAISYTLLLRQEFIFIIPYFVYLLIKRKQWIAFVCIGIFPVLYNIWGWQATGDILYSLHESQKTAALYKTMYPRQGFDHYLTMSGVIFNIVVITLVVAYLGQLFTKQAKYVEYPLLVTAVGFILIHSLFNLKAYPILTSTGGNLRYLLVVSPVMAVIAALSIKNMQYIKNKAWLLITLVPFMFWVHAKMTYTHNWVVMDEGDDNRDFIPALLFWVVAVLLFTIKNNDLLTKILAALSIITVLIYIRPKELCCDENFEQKNIANYVSEQQLDKKPIIQNLGLFDFFLNKNSWEFPAGNTPMDGDSSLDKAPVGSIVIWDTHYAKKYGHVEFSYFQRNSSKYKIIKQFKSDDNAFAAIIFEKISP